MRKAQQVITYRYLDDLILLLDEEGETRDCAQRPELAAMGSLRKEAFDGGATERTVGLMAAAEVMVALHALPVGPGASH